MANTYTLSMEAIDPGAATDPDLCLVSGSIRSVFGSAIAGLVLYIRHIYSPLTLGTDTLILRERQTVKSDRSGAFSFNAIRGATIGLDVPNRPDLHFEAKVPDAASIDIADLILPYVVSIEFDDASPKATAIGERFQLPSTGTLSNGETVDTTTAVTLASSNSAVVLQESDGYFLALAAGSVTVSMSDVDQAKLGLGVESDGDTIVRIGVPATTFPTPITVNAA